MISKFNQAYASNQFDGMSPERIVLALYDGALTAIERAKEAIENGDIAVQGEAIGKAIAIIGELQASLNLQEGGELGERLHALYTYVIQGLLDANIKSDIKILDEMASHISEVREGWVGMMETLADQKKAVAGSDYV